MSLRIARKIVGLNQRRYALKAGVNLSLVNQLELGNRSLTSCTFPTVAALAAALNLQPQELIALVEPQPAARVGHTRTKRPYRRRTPAAPASDRGAPTASRGT